MMNGRGFWGLGLALALSLVPGCASAAPTAVIRPSPDFCLSLNSGQLLFVGKNFAIPDPGECRIFSGLSPSFADPSSLLTGSACATSAYADRPAAALFDLRSVKANAIESWRMTVPLPSGAGGSGTYCAVEHGSTAPTCQAFSIAVVDCVPSRIPVP